MALAWALGAVHERARPSATLMLAGAGRTGDGAGRGAADSSGGAGDADSGRAGSRRCAGKTVLGGPERRDEFLNEGAGATNIKGRADCKRISDARAAKS